MRVPFDDLRTSLASSPDPEADTTNLTPSAILLPILPGPSGDQILFVQRPKSMSNHPGEIAFPGGRVDPEDSGPTETATRELKEELGIRPHQVEILGHLLPQQTFTSGFIIYPVVGRLDRKTLRTPNPEEVDEVLEIPIDDLLRPDSQRWSRFDLPEGTIQSPYYPWEGRTIWGATGRILADLLNLLA